MGLFSDFLWNAVQKILGDIKHNFKKENPRFFLLFQYLDTLPGDQYLFDWSLPLNAPELAAQFNLPEYFEDNILLKTNPGAMYRYVTVFLTASPLEYLLLVG